MKPRNNLSRQLKKPTLVVMLVGLVSALFVLTCQHEPLVAPELPPNNGGSGGGDTVVVCDPDTVFFQQAILPLVIAQCAGTSCHNSITHAGDLVLTNYQQIMNGGLLVPGNPYQGELMEKITTTETGDRMPPPPKDPLPSSQIELLRTWITQGARNNSCVGGCDTSNVSYGGTIAPLLALKCNGCHSGSSPQGGLDLTNWAIVNALALNGRLAGSVQHLPAYHAMPPSGGQLPACEIREIQIWIANGSPNTP